ncbi:MAG: ribosomal RNA small subunit methyltransferase B [Pseudohongiella sp.]|nr:MAG: ribosomal RNA small subunit methyltransferase B [Pseudohongiella sp.]
MSNSRAIVAKILCSLLSDRGSLNTLLGNHKDHPEFGLIQESCYGCCRWYFALESILEQLLNKPLKKQDLDIKCLMICALYQLRELEVAEYAVINESVSAVTIFKKPWAKGLVNAVLRGYQRRREDLEQTLLDSQANKDLAFPEWLLAEIKAQWPEHAMSILQNSNQRPPMTLRVNLTRNSREQYLESLEQAGVGASAGRLANSAVYLDKPAPVTDLPGFSEGRVSVQDEASQLVPSLLRLEPGQRVLDACAAPGGKSCHILESECSLASLTSIDMSQTKLDRIRENLERLDLTSKLVVADAGETDRWWDGQHFDRILLDAPCSATGVIRRHPDVKLLRKPEQIENLVQIQIKLLERLWPCLKPGGILLYTTCSLLRQENEQSIERFLESTDGAKYEAITADWGVECTFGRQLLPGANSGPDGFFYSVIHKE